MRDILSIEDGMDIRVSDSIIPKATNVISVQLGELEYAGDFGADKRYFLSNPVAFQNESYKAYLVKRLSEHGVSTSEVGEVISNLFSTLTFFISEAAPPVFSTQEILSNFLIDADGSMLTDADGAPLLDGLF